MSWNFSSSVVPKHCQIEALAGSQPRAPGSSGKVKRSRVRTHALDAALLLPAGAALDLVLADPAGVVTDDLALAPVAVVGACC